MASRQLSGPGNDTKRASSDVVQSQIDSCRAAGKRPICYGQLTFWKYFPSAREIGTHAMFSSWFREVEKKFFVLFYDRFVISVEWFMRTH